MAGCECGDLPIYENEEGRIPRLVYYDPGAGSGCLDE